MESAAGTLQNYCQIHGKSRVSQYEKISHRRWLKSEKWLNDSAENFKQSHVNNNPYFKLEVQENAIYAEIT